MLTPHLNISHSGFVVVQIMDNNTNTSSYEYKENNDGMAAAVLILVIIFSVVAFLICVCVIVTVIICCCAAAVGINQAAKPPAPPAEMPVNGYQQGTVVEMSPPYDSNQNHNNDYNDK